MQKIKVGLIQQKKTNNAKENIKSCVEEIRKCAKDGANLVVLQELHDHLYFCQSHDEKNFSLAQEIGGKSTRIYSKISKELGIVIVTSIFEKRGALYHNTAIVLDNGKIAGIYRKMHIPHDPNYYEKYYFTPGDTGFLPIQTRLGKLGVLICWDQWFPEAARLMTLAGAKILIYPTAIGWDKMDNKQTQKTQQDAWETIQRSHAIANNIPVVSVNRVGFEADESKQTSGIDFWGHSFACDANGKTIKTLSDTKEQTIVIDIDLAQTKNIRHTWPFFRDRVAKEYAPISQKWLENSHY